MRLLARRRADGRLPGAHVAATRSAWRSSRRTARRTCSGTSRTTTRPTRRSSSSISAPSSRALRALGARRTACPFAVRRIRSPRRSPGSRSATGTAPTTGRWSTASRHPTADGDASEQPVDVGAPAAVAVPGRTSVPVELDGEQFELDHGSVVIAAITSCTNTSNPQVLVTAGLLAKNAVVERGLDRPPWVKSSMAPGSRVVTRYLDQAGLTPALRAARLPHRRLRPHDLHRKLRASLGVDLEGGR